MNYRVRVLREVVVSAFLLALVGIPASGLSQEPNGDAGPAAKAFEELFTSWKTTLGNIRNLSTEFERAEDSELERVRRDFNAQIKAGEELIPQLRVAGIAAYKEAPNADRDLARFLMGMAQDDVANDRYGKAKDLISVMVENDFDAREIFDLAGFVYAVHHDFDKAKKYMKEADSLGVLNLSKTYYGQIDDLAKDWEQEQELRKKEAKDDNLPRVKLETNKGNIVIELFENEAPGTVGNFVSLVEDGFYDGLTFHRVLKGFMAQAGCPEGTGSSGPGYNIYCECHQDNHRKHWTGSLSMAKQNPRNTGGSQFFLCFVPTVHLNGQHTVFGRVIEGLDLLPKILRRTPESEEEPDKIVKATVVRKRDHEYVPNKVR